MSRDFSKVSPKIWDSERFRSLADDSARLAYLYLLSNGHQNSIGCYRLPPEYACADMGWGAEKWAAAFSAVAVAGLVEADDCTKEILIPRWFKHNPPTNPKHALGARRLAEKIESPTLRDTATNELQAAWDKWQADHAPASNSTDSPIRPSLMETPWILSGRKGNRPPIAPR